jgi:MoxR-like ATPase
LWSSFLHPDRLCLFVDDVNAGLKAFIPPSYLSDIEQLILFGKPVLLVGSAGIGKTIGVEYLAKKHDKPFYRVNFDGGMTPESFIGGVRVEAKVDPVTGVKQFCHFFPERPCRERRR